MLKIKLEGNEVNFLMSCVKKRHKRARELIKHVVTMQINKNRYKIAKKLGVCRNLHYADVHTSKICLPIWPILFIES